MKKFLIALFIILSASPCHAMLKVLQATGNMTTAGTWYDGGNSQMPDNYTGTTVVAVNTTPRYTPYFTPSNAADICVGAWFYVANTPTTMTTVTCDLLEGATVRATAQIQFKREANTGTYGPTTGGVFFKFVTPYTYLNTTAGTWRFRLTGADANIVNFRAVTTTAAYIEVKSTSTALAANDCLYMCGYGTVAGTYTTVLPVTMDSTYTLGAAGFDAIQIGKGATLTWGDSQGSAMTLTCNSGSHIRIIAGTFNFGTLAHPLTSTYVQTITMKNASASFQSEIIALDGTPNYTQYQYDVPTISMYGNYAYNQASDAVYKSTTATQSNNGQAVIVLTSDMGLRAGGGDVIMVTGTNGLNEGELLTTASYVSATKTITCTTNLDHTHAATTTFVCVMNANALIQSDGATYITRITINGAPQSGPTVAANISISNVECLNNGGFNTAHASSTSLFQYVRTRGNNSTSAFYWSAGRYIAADKCIAFIVNNTYIGFASSSKYTNCIISSNGAYYAIPGGGLTNNESWTDCFMDVYWRPTNTHVLTMTRCTISGSSQAGFTFGADSFDMRAIDCIEGSPAVNQYGMSFSGGNSVTARFYNQEINSAIPIRVLHTANPGTYLAFQNYDNTDIGDHRFYKTEGFFTTCGAGGLYDSTVRTAGEIGLGMFPTASGTLTYSANQLTQSITKAVQANQTVVWTGYLRKNANWGSLTRPTVTLTSDDGNISQTSTMTDVDNTWEIFTLSGTVGAAPAFITLTISGSTLNASAAAYCSDSMLFLGNASSGTATGFKVYTLWKDGEPTADETLGGTVDATFLENSVWNAVGASHNTVSTMGRYQNDINIKVDDNQSLILSR